MSRVKFNPDAISTERLARGDITPEKARRAEASPSLLKRLRVSVPCAPGGGARLRGGKVK